MTNGWRSRTPASASTSEIRFSTRRGLPSETAPRRRACALVTPCSWHQARNGSKVLRFFSMPARGTGSPSGNRQPGVSARCGSSLPGGGQERRLALIEAPAGRRVCGVLEGVEQVAGNPAAASYTARRRTITMHDREDAGLLGNSSAPAFAIVGDEPLHARACHRERHWGRDAEIMASIPPPISNSSRLRSWTLVNRKPAGSSNGAISLRPASLTPAWIQSITVSGTPASCWASRARSVTAVWVHCGMPIPLPLRSAAVLIGNPKRHENRAVPEHPRGEDRQADSSASCPAPRKRAIGRKREFRHLPIPGWPGIDRR